MLVNQLESFSLLLHSLMVALLIGSSVPFSRSSTAGFALIIYSPLPGVAFLWWALHSNFGRVKLGRWLAFLLSPEEKHREAQLIANQKEIMAESRGEIDGPKSIGEAANEKLNSIQSEAAAGESTQSPEAALVDDTGHRKVDSKDLVALPMDINKDKYNKKDKKKIEKKRAAMGLHMQMPIGLATGTEDNVDFDKKSND